MCAKVLFQLELSRESAEQEFGMAVEAELAEDTEEEDELCVFISDILKGGLAHKKGRWMCIVNGNINCISSNNLYYHFLQCISFLLFYSDVFGL